jgi:hypothetical protein
MVPGEAHEVVTARRSSQRELDGLAEDCAPLRAARTELCRRRKGDVDLEAARQKEDPVDGRAERQVPVVERLEVLDPPRVEGSVETVAPD